MAITFEQAKSLTHGTILYHTIHTDAKGRPCKWRVAGKPKTWKTAPTVIRVPLRYGMQKTTCHLTEDDFDLFSLTEWEATGKKMSFKKTDENEYTLHFDGKMYGIIFKDEKGWTSSRVCRDEHFKTRIECAKNVLDCLY
jgi:hypothetical protein